MTERIIKLPFDVPLLAIINLRAGDLSCIYERGNLRNISFAGAEVVRMIYGAVRVINWETVPNEITKEEILINEESFTISYTAFYEYNNTRYKGDFTLIGRKDSSIYFSMKGEALTTFKKNRIGLCLLHPLKECAGKDATIIQPGNGRYKTFFPEQITPHQPFKQISKMEWQIEGNSNAQLVFKGDIFETEDQRNWGDSSYKTYSTPVDIPYPVMIFKGETIEQSIELKITKSDRPLQKLPGVAIKTTAKKIPFPKIGYSRLPGSKLLTDAEIGLLTKIPFNHYRIDLYLFTPGWKNELIAAATEAKKINTSLEIIAFFSGSFSTELEHLLSAMQKLPANVISILPLQAEHKVTPLYLLKQVFSRIKNAFPHINIGYGTDGFFAELNQQQPADFDFDFVNFSLHPQVHANDTRTIMQNLECYGQLINSIEKFTAKPAHISITFQERYNPHDRETIHHIKNENTFDDRLNTSFGAAWTLLCLRNLCKAGSVTLYQTTGKSGLVSRAENMPETPSPLYNLLVQIKTFDPVNIFLEAAENKEKIVLENNFGDLLTYFVSPVFINCFQP